MSHRDWSCEKQEENRTQIEWVCVHNETEESVTVSSDLKEEKVFPQEDYEYTGTINGKEVFGSATTGHGAMRNIYSVEGEDDLTDAETAAGFAHINNLF